MYIKPAVTLTEKQWNAQVVEMNAPPPVRQKYVLSDAFLGIAVMFLVLAVLLGRRKL